MPASFVEDEQAFMWLAGVPDGARVIVQGQDFVREGQRVDAVPAAPDKSPSAAGAKDETGTARC